jgi:hypothetical protein
LILAKFCFQCGLFMTCMSIELSMCRESSLDTHCEDRMCFYPWDAGWKTFWRVGDVCFWLLSGRVGLPNFLFLSLVNVIAHRYRTRVAISCGLIFTVREPLNNVVRHFNEVAGLFDFHLSRNQFFNRQRSRLTLHYLLDNTVRIFKAFYSWNGLLLFSLHFRFELLTLALYINKIF